MCGFEWDPKKNQSNLRKHGIDFEDAVEAFEGPYLEAVDERFDYGEERVMAFGLMGPSVVAVVFVWRGENRRILSARKTTKGEAREYFEAVYGSN